MLGPSIQSRHSVWIRLQPWKICDRNLLYFFAFSLALLHSLPQEWDRRLGWQEWAQIWTEAVEMCNLSGFRLPLSVHNLRHSQLVPWYLVTVASSSWPNYSSRLEDHTWSEPPRRMGISIIVSVLDVRWCDLFRVISGNRTHGHLMQLRSGL